MTNTSVSEQTHYCTLLWQGILASNKKHAHFCLDRNNLFSKMNGKGLCLQCDRKYIYFENTWPGLWLHVTGLYFYKLSFCVSLYVSCSFSLYVCMVSCAHIHAFTVSWCLMIVFMTKVSYLSLSLVAFPQPLPSECVCVWERERAFPKAVDIF